MTAWRYKIYLLMLKNISLVREYYSTLAEKYFISPCSHEISSISYWLKHEILLQLFKEVNIFYSHLLTDSFFEIALWLSHIKYSLCGKHGKFEA